MVAKGHGIQGSWYPRVAVTNSVPPPVPSSSPLQQHCDGHRLPVPCGIVQRGVLVVVHDVQRGLGGDERLGTLDLTVPTGWMVMEGLYKASILIIAHQ